jgi:hypothetical protein
MSDTPGYARAHPGVLSTRQLAAVDLIAAGWTDTQTAAHLGLSRVTVTRWRCYSPEFRAAVAGRRNEIWSASLDKLRYAVARSLDVVLADVMNKGSPTRHANALALLKLVRVPLEAPTGPTTAEGVLLEEAKRRRQELTARMSPLEALTHEPELSEVLPLVREELDRLSGGPDHGEGGGQGRGKEEVAGGAGTAEARPGGAEACPAVEVESE